MSEVSTKRPNVVVLFPDQLRALSLPLFGEQQIETPNIDRLAADSLAEILRRTFVATCSLKASAIDHPESASPRCAQLWLR